MPDTFLQIKDYDPVARALDLLQKECHLASKSKGWWDGTRNIPEMLCLMHSEVSEALEDYRKGRAVGLVYYHPTPDQVRGGEIVGLPKPEGIPIEMADIVIRVMDFCGGFGIHLAAAIELKLAYNRTRPDRHGGLKC